MKKSIKSIKKIIYKLNEEDKKAIKRVYDLLYEIEDDMEANDIMEVNDGELFEFQYSEIEEIYDGIIGFLKADFLKITRECAEESEVQNENKSILRFRWHCCFIIYRKKLVKKIV